MLRRSQGLRFGNYFAFPGGMIEKQDYAHKWIKNMPEYLQNYLGNGLTRFPDFTKRMTAIRELFEECNILLADEQNA